MAEIDSSTKELAHDLMNAFLSLKHRLNLANQSEELELIKKNIEMAISRVDEAINYCQEHMTVNNEKEKLAVGHFIQSSHIIFLNNYQEIKIHFKIEDDFKLNFSRSSLLNACFNILKNSVEAKATEMTITVNQGQVLFCDNGPGMSKESLDQLKDLKSTKKDGHGIGLLSIARFCRNNGLVMHFKNNHPGDLYDHGFCILMSSK